MEIMLCFVIVFFFKSFLVYMYIYVFVCGVRTLPYDLTKVLRVYNSLFFLTSFIRVHTPMLRNERQSVYI